MLPRTFHAPPRFHPGYSLLSRWLRRHTGDRRYAEALHIALMTGFALALVFGHFLSGALWTATATPQTPTVYWLVQAGLAGLALATAIVGFRPALAVTCTADTVRIEQGDHTLTVPHTALAAVQRITAQRFHRHERRYAATHAFLGVLGGEVLLLRLVRGGPLVIGLPASEQAALQQLLEETARVPTRTENASVEGREGELERG